MNGRRIVSVMLGALASASGAGAQTCDLAVRGSLNIGWEGCAVPRIVVREEVAYISAGSGGLKVVDVSDPDAPAVIGQLVLPNSVVIDQALEWPRVYLTMRNPVNDALVVVDVSLPSAPVAIGSHPIVLSDAIACNWAAVAVRSGIALVGDVTGLTVIDTTDPADMKVLGQTALGGFSAASVTLGAQHAYVGYSDSQHARLGVVDISDPASPGLIASATHALVQRSALGPSGSVLYAAENGGFTTWDVSDPATPVRLDGVGPQSTGVALSEGRAFQASNEASHTLNVYDVSDPADLWLLGALYTGEPAFAVHAVGDLVYMITGLPPVAQLVIVDASGCRVCSADFNGDGGLSVADFTAFRAAYLAGDLAADFTGDGSLGVSDFTAFRNAYLAGCP